jgi:hypothetical protein
LERDRAKNIAHVYVVWNQWADLDRSTRSELILDAAEEVLGLQKSLKIIVAMGLTKTEAKAMRLGAA